MRMLRNRLTDASYMPALLPCLIHACVSHASYTACASPMPHTCLRFCHASYMPALLPCLIHASWAGQEEWAKGKTVQNCPRCRRRHWKEGGCPHMTCPCGHQYCWYCRPHICLMPVHVMCTHSPVWCTAYRATCIHLACHAWHTPSNHIPLP